MTSSAACPVGLPVAESRTGAGRRRAKERSPGHGPAALLVPGWVTSRCAPRCRAGALFVLLGRCLLGLLALLGAQRLNALELGDVSAVAGLGLLGHLALGIADRRVGLPDACTAPTLASTAVSSSRRSFFVVNEGCV